VDVSAATDGSSTEYVTPFQVFYIQWRPDSGALGVLGAGGEGTALAIIDLGDGQVTQRHSAGSFYFVWSPDGKTLVTHLNGSIIELVDVATGRRTPIDAETGTFEAPQWTPDGESIIYIRPVIVQTAGVGGLVAAQANRDELVVHNGATDEITVLAEDATMNGFSLSPDGTEIAYTTARSGVETDMFVVDLATGERESLDVGLVFAWQWSPDSRKILVFGIEGAGIVLRVWEGGTVTDYFRALPTGTFFNRYLIFWGQYTRSMTVWAPDSSAFVFAATDRGDDYIFVQRLKDEFPSLVAPGSVASFSPIGDSTN
jgi:Tol biopolymer transport system component